MYVCADCGYQFDTPRVLRETHGEEFDVCPACGEDRIDPAEQCRNCGDYEAAYKLTDGYCDECLAIWRDGFRAALREKFTDEELFLISVAMDGETIDFPDPAVARHDMGAVA